MSTLPGIFLELIVRFLRHIEMKRASQTSLLGESAPAPQTRAELEAAAQVFDLIKDRIQSIEQLNLDVTKMQRAYRSNLFAGWLQNSDQVNLLRGQYNPRFN